MSKGPGLVYGKLVFPLSRISNVLGRLDRTTGARPDIDLTVLGQGKMISRRHAEATYREGGFYLRDLGSQLGTFVNAEPLDTHTQRHLKEGDTVTIAGVTFTYEVAAEWPEGVLAEWIAEEEFGQANDTTVMPGRVSLISQLPKALRESQLLVHYQPQVDFKTGFVKSVEALTRWQHPTMGMIPPSSFIPLAEDTGFIGSITSFVILTAAKQASAWRNAGADIVIAVNVSIRDLEDPEFGKRALKLVEGSGIKPDRLMIEITESAAMTRPEKAISTLRRLKGMGFGLSIDDFGTGQSSLSYLSMLPADEVKIDQSFAASIGTTEEAVIRATVQLAHELGMIVVAEGIKALGTATKLRSLGIDKGQGYYYGRPVPSEKLDTRMVFPPDF